MNKKIFFLMIAVLIIWLSFNAYADEIGCCSNPAAGSQACSADLVNRDAQCCPAKETSPSYYKPANANGPADTNECKNSFFTVNQACEKVAACEEGCCCSDLGGNIKSKALCTGSDVFHEGETDCDEFCPTPECNDGEDNDHNGCEDFLGGDSGCIDSSDSSERGGSCLGQSVGCSDQIYAPKLSNLVITPVSGKKSLFLEWRDECKINAVLYDIFRCKGQDCTAFTASFATSSTNLFEDSSAELEYDTTYTYQVKAHYSPQSATPVVKGYGTIGNKDCNSGASKVCTNNIAYKCDAGNLVKLKECTSTQACVISNNNEQCLNKDNCNYIEANPFGLFYTMTACESGKYCFYDKSATTANSCFSCNPAMSCYDYKSKDSCERDNCGVNLCQWRDSITGIGVGACTKTADYNCKWCNTQGTAGMPNLLAYNTVFDVCTAEKLAILSSATFKCYMSNGKASGCDETKCSDYDASQCSATKITHNGKNEITNPSADQCGIKVCQKINSKCAKNADGDDIPDCEGAANPALCESDYFAPNTTITVTRTSNNIINSLLIQVKDKTSFNGDYFIKATADYATFFCLKPCTNGHIFPNTTKSRKIIISNLNGFDSSTGKLAFSLKEGTNTIQYYSQDPSKNIEEIETIEIVAYDNTDGQRIFYFNVTGSSSANDIFYTNQKKPIIKVEFFEEATIIGAKLTSKDRRRIIQFTISNSEKKEFELRTAEDVPDGEYTFELQAKNSKNIFMQPFTAEVVIDTTKPKITVTPAEGTVIAEDRPVQVKLIFDEIAIIDAATISSQNIKDKLTTTNNKEFTGAVFVSDGNKMLQVNARDFAGNAIVNITQFVMDAKPMNITLAKPKYGVAQDYSFEFSAATDNNANCKFEIDNDAEYEFMQGFGITGGIIHSKQSVSIKTGDTGVHKFYVKCKDTRKNEILSKEFDISVDKTKPVITRSFAFPGVVADEPYTATLNAQTDEQTMCKFSISSTSFDSMDGKFDGFDEETFSTINTKSIRLSATGDYSYKITCRNKAGLDSNTATISFKVDPGAKLKITSHTPYFFNSTTATLAFETNRNATCRYSQKEDMSLSEAFGPSGYSHTRDIVLAEGSYNFYISCKGKSETATDKISVEFFIDTSAPTLISVDDSSTLENTEYTWDPSTLRVKWNSEDKESGIKSHTYSIVDAVSLRVVLDWSTSYVNNQWLQIQKPNKQPLGLVDEQKYFFKVKSTNLAGLQSEEKQSDGIIVNSSRKPSECANGVKDTAETDVDCGNRCGACDTGKKCSANGDCRSLFCKNNACEAPTCTDNVQNQDEGDTDCGGVCSKCAENRKCNENNDCGTGLCIAAKCRQQQVCFDGVFTQGESDVDCGGPCPTKCTETKHCNEDTDCSRGLNCYSSSCRGVTAATEEAPTNTDTDGDGMPDSWEVANGMDPNDPSDADLDSDDDGLTNIEEFDVYNTYGESTDPNNSDTDNDGKSDKEEIDSGTNPIDPADFKKSGFGTILMFIFGILIMVSGFGYLAYRVMSKRSESSFRDSSTRTPTMARQPMQQQATRVQPASKPQMQPRIRTASDVFRRKEEEKERERQRLFEPFESEKTTKPEQKQEQNQQRKSKQKENKITPKKTASKSQTKKQSAKQEDVFAKLKSISEKKR